MASSRGSSIEAYEQLRADILGGRIRPGEHMPFNSLCERYKTSVGAIREALMRLSEQGLVRGAPSQGFRVTPISAGDLRELTDARCELEVLVLGRAILEGDVNWESRVVAAHHVLARTAIAEADDPDRLSESWVVAHADFHEAILDGCTNRRLLAIASGLRDSAELYRRWSYAVERDHERDIEKEHREILEAVIGRQGLLAQERLRQHIAATTEFLLKDVDAGNQLEDLVFADGA
jgi:DNA-binding GntR family transcriptional regulator